MELYAIPVVAEARQWLFRLPLRERERALAIGHARARAQFVVGRLAVRALLGERLGLPLAEVDLRTGPAGAPELAGADWNFNISHAGNWAVVALCRGLPVGIDIESLRPFADALQVARQHLHRDEQSWLLSIPAACRSTAFLRLWVCKEAVIKAARRGLWMRLDDWVALSAAPHGEPFEVVDGDLRPWRIHPFDICPRHVGALASSSETNVVTATRVTLEALMNRGDPA